MKVRPVIPGLVAASALAFPQTSLLAESSPSQLEQRFKNPPTAVRPYVWWHWMGSNVSKSGITKDLEAMKASGIGGATIFNITSAVQESHKPMGNLPWPDQTYRSPKYWDAVRHAAAEAKRLGLEIGLHNTVGYSTTGGPWIDEAKNMRQLTFSQVEVEGGKSVQIEIPRPAPVVYKGWGATGKVLEHIEDIAVLASPARAEVDPKQVIDVTKQFQNGRLTWNAPAGAWRITRICHSPTGATPHPMPDELIGVAMEVDKLSAELNQFHWDQVIDPLRKHLGPLLGTGLRHFLIDSYEAGAQNWTAKFREEFQQRKGYDPLPWLLTQKGVTVGNADLTERFKWDMADVIQTLYYEHGWMVGKKKIQQAGATLQFEPYGGSFNTLDGAALADLPMGEFWTTGGGGISQAVVAGARAGGKTVIGAEAFTGPPTLSKWSETPGFLKRSADGSFLSGANRMVLHHWVHQPFDDRYKPGMGMGWWGTHFNRHQTWARDGVAFYQYLGRCQALLQSGETPVDVLNVGKPGNQGDAISWRAFRDGLRVNDGRVVLPSGRRYPVMVLQHDGAMTPGDLQIVEDLLKQGVHVVGKAPTTSPGLSGFPESEQRVRKAAASLWGAEPIRQIGKGKLFTQGDLGLALRTLGLVPDVQIQGGQGVAGLRRSSREADIFFLVNPAGSPVRFTASLEVTGKRPELWDAQSGSIAFAPVWRQAGERTEVDLALGAQRSIFVVFRSREMPADHTVAIDFQGAKPPEDLMLTATADGSVSASSTAAINATLRHASGKTTRLQQPAPAPATELTGPWQVKLDSPVDAERTISMETLSNLAGHQDPGVKYFSGTATYQIRFDAAPGARITLDLGACHDLARVQLNNRDLGVIWQSPFTIDLTPALVSGTNQLSIDVTNTWHNRLVGDEQFPADFEWGEDRGPKGRAMKAYPDWFIKGAKRPEANRKCFVTWYYHKADTPLLPAGLVGPVRLLHRN